MNSFQTPSQAARQNRRARGGAMVEFVVLNIALVPLLLFSMFLMDAAYLKLDLQETVVSGAWDFSQRNTEPPADTSGVTASNSFNSNNGMELQATAKAVRIVYADHTSAFDDGGEVGSQGYGNATRLRGNGDGSTGPSGHMRHHTGFGAQYTFRFKAPPANAEEDEEEGTSSGGALEGVGTELDTQFKCTISTDMSWSLDPSMTAYGQSGYNAGGEARCSSIAFIYNYIIPEKFLQEFSETDQLTKMKRRRDETADGAHEYQGQGGRIGNIVAEETAAISFNTWALRNGAKNTYNSTSGYGAKHYSTYNGALADADIGDRGFLGMSEDPNENPFYRRVQYMYSNVQGPYMATYGLVSARAAQFMQKATFGSDKMLTTYAAPLLLGVRPPNTLPGVGVPNIAGVFMTARYTPTTSANGRYPKQGQPSFLGGGGGDFLSTPYDNHNNKYGQAASNRGQYYMGCQSQETPSCF
jgi:hypothetical protein